MPLSPGGLIPGGPVAVKLTPEECVLAVRDQRWVCIRAHDPCAMLHLDPCEVDADLLQRLRPDLATAVE